MMQVWPLMIALLSADMSAADGEYQIIKLEVCSARKYELATGRSFRHLYVPITILSQSIVIEDTVNDGCSILSVAGKTYSIRGNPEQLFKAVDSDGLHIILIEPSGGEE